MADPTIQEYRQSEHCRPTERNQYAAMFYAAMLANQNLTKYSTTQPPTPVTYATLAQCFEDADRLLAMGREREDNALMDWMQLQRKHRKGY